MTIHVDRHSLSYVEYTKLVKNDMSIDSLFYRDYNQSMYFSVGF